MVSKTMKGEGKDPKWKSSRYEKEEGGDGSRGGKSMGKKGKGKKGMGKGKGGKNGRKGKGKGKASKKGKWVKASKDADEEGEEAYDAETNCDDESEEEYDGNEDNEEDAGPEDAGNDEVDPVRSAEQKSAYKRKVKTVGFGKDPESFGWTYLWCNRGSGVACFKKFIRGDDGWCFLHWHFKTGTAKLVLPNHWKVQYGYISDTKFINHRDMSDYTWGNILEHPRYHTTVGYRQKVNRMKTMVEEWREDEKNNTLNKWADPLLKKNGSWKFRYVMGKKDENILYFEKRCWVEKGGNGKKYEVPVVYKIDWKYMDGDFALYKYDDTEGFWRKASDNETWLKALNDPESMCKKQ